MNNECLEVPSLEHDNRSAKAALINGTELAKPMILAEGVPNPAPASLDSLLGSVKARFGSTPSIVDGTEACISAICSLLLADNEGCIALILEGPAASGKTTVLQFFRTKQMLESGLIVATDNFTPASFVSHAANRKKDQLTKIDLLPRIKHKTLVVADLAPTLSSRKEELDFKLGVLTRVLDGQGYESDSGS